MFFLLFRSHKQVSRCFIPMIMKWWHDELMKINILKSYSSGNNQYRGGSGWNNLKDRCSWLWLWYFVDFWHAFAHPSLSLVKCKILTADIPASCQHLGGGDQVGILMWESTEGLKENGHTKKGSDALPSALYRQKTVALYTRIFEPKLLQYRAKSFPILGWIFMKIRKCAVLLSPLQSRMGCIRLIAHTSLYLFVFTFCLYYTLIVLYL